MQTEITFQTEEELVIEIKNIEAPFANTLRRIMIAEVPTMAIEDIELYQNTSVIPDEILAHRLGLVPIHADPNDFIYRNEDERSQDNSIMFKFHKKCYKDENGQLVNEKVYSSSLEWIPIGSQSDRLQDVRPVHDDILIVQLGEGQEIEAYLHCEKGIGATHAKWSPVATASYRLMPDILLQPGASSKELKKLVDLCPANVFDIEDGHVVVSNPKNCTTCRECIRNSNAVNLGKLKTHFIFTIEAVGQIKPLDILKESLRVLIAKCEQWIDKLALTLD